MTDDMILTLGISILTSSLLILSVALLRTLFHRRIPMRLQYALWLLVAVRLLILPVPVIRSPLSVLRLAGALKTAESSPDSSNAAIFPDFGALPDRQKTPAPSTAADDRPKQANRPQTFEQTSPQPGSAAPLFLSAAAVGSGALFLYFLAGNIRLALYLRKKRVPFDGECGIGLPVYTVNGLPSPCLYGRSVYITAAMAEDTKKLKHILVHEYCHYRQGDTVWSALRCLCVTLYWWNPLVWLAASLSREDCELSCDEAALRILGQSERLAYAKTLIGMIPVKTDPLHSGTIAAAMSEGGKSMKKRIRTIASAPKTARSATILLAAAALICFVSMSTTVSALPQNEAKLPADTETDRRNEPDETDSEAARTDEPTETNLEIEWQNEPDETDSGTHRTGEPDETSPKNGQAARPDETDSGTARTDEPDEINPKNSQAAGPSEETPDTQAVRDLDQAVGLAVLSFNRGRFSEAELAAEGHILLGETTDKDSNTVVYCLTMYGEYQFQDNAFVKESGTGAIPAVLTFSGDESAGYVLQSFTLPEDGGLYVSSIRKLFPKELQDRCLRLSDEDVDHLTKQEREQASRYLQQLGRNAVIGHYGDFPHTLLTDAGVSVEVSNLMCDGGKFDKMWKYPDWIGNREWIEDGVRYVYAMALDPDAHEIIYTKSEYDTGTVTETHVFDSLTAEEKSSF